MADFLHSTREISDRIDLSAEARSLLADGMAPGQYLQHLAERSLYSDAITFVSASLSPRQAVWFGCLCVEHLAPPPAGELREALGAAVRWVLDPSEERRQHAAEAGDRAGLATPSGALAKAASWTSGSMAPGRSVPPPPGISAKTIAAAINLAAAQGPPKRLAERYCQALVLGIDVSTGSRTWN